MTPATPSAEFTFELLVCRWAELAWPPEDDRNAAVLVARQLGTRRRRWDTVVVEADPDGFRERRRRFGDEELDSDLLHLVRNAPADWEWYRDALPQPGYPWRYVREAIHRADERGVLETRRNGNRIEIRRVAPYPDWLRRVVAVENKPDLDASAARALSDQLEHDVETALADEVWVATGATGAAVEPALLEDVPVEVGILAFDFADGVSPSVGRIEWYPSALSPDETAGRGAERAERRLELAERAFGRGWRSYHSTMRPDCRHYRLGRAGAALVPECGAKSRRQTAAECSGNCPEFSPEPPQWRTRGWPIEGGPGKGIRRLLRDRRERARDRAEGKRKGR